jgi:hypothetical protein
VKNFSKIITFWILFFSSTSAMAGFCDRYDCVAQAESIIGEDSSSWFMNRFDRGSVRFNKITFEAPSGLKVRFKVDYTYNGGREGWAEIEVIDGEFSCIRYHDFPNDCRSRKKF